MAKSAKVRVKILKGVIIEGTRYFPAKEGEEANVIVLPRVTALELEYYKDVEILEDAPASQPTALEDDSIVFASKEAEKLFKDGGLYEHQVVGTGADGKVTVTDVQDAIDAL